MPRVSPEFARACRERGKEKILPVERLGPRTRKVLEGISQFAELGTVIHPDDRDMIERLARQAYDLLLRDSKR